MNDRDILLGGIDLLTKHIDIVCPNLGLAERFFAYVTVGSHAEPCRYWISGNNLHFSAKKENTDIRAEPSFVSITDVFEYHMEQRSSSFTGVTFKRQSEVYVPEKFFGEYSS